MRRFRLFFLIGSLGILVLTFCACQQVSILGHKKVEVSASEAWTDTGVDLKAGQAVEITAEGEVLISEEIASTPGGVVDPNVGTMKKLLWKVHSVTRDAPHGALIGKIGDEGKPFFVGEESLIEASSEGRLYLGINDKDTKNNQGTYEAKIDLE
jgi:hypothetical protein